MKSEIIGAGTSEAEVLNISPHGFWLAVAGTEYFLDFAHFPWFQDTTIRQISAVKLLHQEHLYWPDLDVDLDLDRIRHPDKYPLVYSESLG
jgi:hypothetical protein